MRYIIRATLADLRDLAHDFGLGRAIGAAPLALVVFAVETTATTLPYSPTLPYGNRVGRFVLSMGLLWSLFLMVGS